MPPAPGPTGAVVFDFDGPAGNTIWMWTESREEAFVEMGIGLPPEKRNDTLSKSDRVYMEMAGAPERLEEFKARYFAKLRALIPRAELEAGAMEALAWCKAEGIGTAIVTFAYRWYIDAVLEKLGLSGAFDCVLAFEDVKNPKPAPDSIRIVAERLGISAGEIVVVVGDSSNDIWMGNAAGSRTILYNHGGHSPYRDRGKLMRAEPGYVARDFGRVAAIILELSSGKQKKAGAGIRGK